MRHVLIVTLMVTAVVSAQDPPNPYRAIEGWGQLPKGRTWGATSAVYPARDGNM
jgi:hypothetical protein